MAQSVAGKKCFEYWVGYQDAKSKVTLVREWIKQNPRPPSTTIKLDEVPKIDPPVKEPYNGGTGEAAKKAALQAQQVCPTLSGSPSRT